MPTKLQTPKRYFGRHYAAKLSRVFFSKNTHTEWLMTGTEQHASVQARPLGADKVETKHACTRNGWGDLGRRVGFRFHLWWHATDTQQTGRQQTGREWGAACQHAMSPPSGHSSSQGRAGHCCSCGGSLAPAWHQTLPAAPTRLPFPPWTHLAEAQEGVENSGNVGIIKEEDGGKKAAQVVGEKKDGRFFSPPPPAGWKRRDARKETPLSHAHACALPSAPRTHPDVRNVSVASVPASTVQRWGRTCFRAAVAERGWARQTTTGGMHVKCVCVCVERWWWLARGERQAPSRGGWVGFCATRSWTRRQDTKWVGE